RIFHNPNKIRDIAISHIGTTQGRPERENCLNFIGSRGIKVYSRGGQRQDYLPVEEYADILQRSLITLNWAENSKFKQLKGRIFEAMLCGACLFESENDEIKKYFVAGEDYVSFKGNNVEAVAYMLRSSTQEKEGIKEAQRIAANGHKKATELYNAANFWKIVFERAGINGYRHTDSYVKEAFAETALAN
ncbi:MAG: glycosyltransferase, partial [Planctomycetota bacterium]|nr:glycosyltransferase [Planctomycetota bacterium]